MGKACLLAFSGLLFWSLQQQEPPPVGTQWARYQHLAASLQYTAAEHHLE